MAREYQNVFQSTRAYDNHVLRSWSSTGNMSTRQIADYLASQREKGWPKSTSIHSKPLSAAKLRAE